MEQANNGHAGFGQAPVRKRLKILLRGDPFCGVSVIYNLVRIKVLGKVSFPSCLIVGDPPISHRVSQRRVEVREKLIVSNEDSLIA